MNNIDLHIICSPGRERWREECINSTINEPVNTHLVQASGDNIGAARARGFALGSADYVSFLDDDDYLLPGCYSPLIAALDSMPDSCGVYGDAVLVTDTGAVIAGPEPFAPWHHITQLCTWGSKPGAVHQPVLMRREQVELFLSELSCWPYGSEYVLFALLTKFGRWHHVNQEGLVMGAGYAYRQHTGSAKHQARTTAWRQRAIAFARPILRAAG